MKSVFVRILPRLPAALLLTGGLILLQLHASDYWTQHAGRTGLLWSLMIEGAAMWLWAARSLGKNALALVASLLALSAPLYQLGQPVYTDWQTSQQQRLLLQQQIDQQQQAITRLEAKSTTYQQNSVKRDGWAKLIEQTEQQIQAAETKRNRLQTEQAGYQAGADLAALTPVAMTALGLVLIQLLVILTTRTVFAPIASADERTRTAAAPAAGEAGPSTGCAAASHPYSTPQKTKAPKPAATGRQRLMPVAA